jgi:hypothetical protein
VVRNLLDFASQSVVLILYHFGIPAVALMIVVVSLNLYKK